MGTSKRRYNTTGLKSEIFEGLAETSDRRYLIIYNMDTAVARFSKNAVEYFGLKGEYDTEILDTIGPLLHKNDVESVMNLITQILTKQRDRAICDFRIRNKAGEYVACSLNGIVKGKYFLISIENHSISDNIDGTTSLYNVVEFWKYIKGLHENSESAVLLFIGIQNFTEINHLYGYTVGDKVLRRFADILREHMRGGDNVFRGEGVSFMYCSKGYNIDEIKALYADLQHHFKYDIYVDNIGISVNIAGGAVLFNEDFDIDTAQTGGRYALSNSKYEQFGNLVIFNNKMLTDTEKYTELMSVMRKSITNGCEGYYLCYQPIMDAGSEKVIGAEALIRWHNDKFGEVPPGQFINWLENDPYFLELGEWILKTAMNDAKEFIKKIPEFVVNVNITYSQLSSKKFRQQVNSALNETGFPPEHLCLELTERCKLLNMDELKVALAYFRKMGIKIALADFATGYASLNLLSELNVNVLKFDYGFTKELQTNEINQHILKAIAECAQKLDVHVCLEGMESRELVDFSKQYDIYCYQGFYFSKPIKKSEFEEYISA